MSMLLSVAELWIKLLCHGWSCKVVITIGGQQARSRKAIKRLLLVSSNSTGKIKATLQTSTHCTVAFLLKPEVLLLSTNMVLLMTYAIKVGTNKAIVLEIWGET